MNDQADALDQVDEDILCYALSDEALEAAAGPAKGEVTAMYSTMMRPIDCVQRLC